MAWLKAIPGLISLAKELVNAFKYLIEGYRIAKREGWIADGKDLSKKIKGSTDEEKKDLARKVLEHIRNMPSR